MFAFLEGPEFLIIAIVLIVLIAALMVMALAHSRSQRVTNTVHQVGTTQEEFIRHLTVMLASSGNRRVEIPAPGTVVVISQYVHPLLIIPIVLLFPVGLLFLLIKSTGRTVLVVTPCPTGSSVTVSGWLSESLAKGLEQMFGRLALTATPAIPFGVPQGAPATAVGFGVPPALPGAGGPMPASPVLCSRCGNGLAAGVKFCGVCGTPAGRV